MSGDTIFAIASGSGRAAVAVVRLSGPAAGSALAALAGSLPAPRTTALRRLRDPADGRVLDHAVVLWFPAPASFTGEDCAELHLHGSRAVLDAVLGALAARPGCRLATAGEFTRRAYLNGKMDLAAVEGLADLIDAQTEAQRRQALRQLDGALGAWVAVQRSRLLRALATAESAIDFADEGDVAGDLGAEALHLVVELQEAIAAELDRAAASSRVREGVVIVLSGPPNAGKSTLLNALARREIAIVSPHPGTTRDLIEIELDLAGCLVTVIDTAGLRDSDDPVEREGVTRARARAASADLVLWLSDATAPQLSVSPPTANRLWRVATKVDLVRDGAHADADFFLAVPTGRGLAALIDALTAFAASDRMSAESAVTSRLRHRRALIETQDALAAISTFEPSLALATELPSPLGGEGPQSGDEGFFREDSPHPPCRAPSPASGRRDVQTLGAEHSTTPVQAGENGLGMELVAEQLRHAAQCLDSLVGRIETEEVLGEIFARFCIGK